MNDYEKKAKNFLKKADTTMRILQIGVVNGFPNDPSDKQKHIKYRVVLTRHGKVFDFDFYGSHADYLARKLPSEYDVLACIEKYEYPTDPWMFAREFGYEITCEDDYKRVKKIAEECSDQYWKLIDLFGDELMAELQEI